MPPLTHNLIRFLVALTVCLSVTCGLHAHGPLDLSTRATLYPDRIELVSALGPDAARLVLEDAKCSPELIKNSLLYLGRKHVVRQPESLSATCFTLESAGAVLSPQSVTSYFDGEELLLTFTFPRPAAGTLSIKAVCLQRLPRLPSGIFSLRDDSGRRLGSGVLSAKTPELQFSLPPTPTPQK